MGMFGNSGLDELFEKLVGRKKFVFHSMLSREDEAEWGVLEHEMNEVKCKAKELEARRTLFWSKIERKTNIYDADMRIENGSTLLVEDKSTSNKEPDGHAASCSGDCASCGSEPTP